MSTPVAFVGEYPMGRNQAKMVESTTNVSSVEWNGNLQRFVITHKTTRNWAEMVENYDSCFVGHPELQTCTVWWQSGFPLLSNWNHKKAPFSKH